MPLNYLDIFILIIMLFFGIRGALRGFLEEVSTLIGIVGGFYLARTYSVELIPYLEGLFSASTAHVVAFVAIMLVIMLIVSLVARLIAKMLDVAFAGWIDHLFGALFGVIKGFVIAFIVTYAISWLFPEHVVVQKSHFAPYILDLAKDIMGYANQNMYFKNYL